MSQMGTTSSWSKRRIKSSSNLIIKHLLKPNISPWTLLMQKLSSDEQTNTEINPQSNRQHSPLLAKERRTWSDYRRDFRITSSLEDELMTGKFTGKNHNRHANPDNLSTKKTSIFHFRAMCTQITKLHTRTQIGNWQATGTTSPSPRIRKPIELY